MPLIPEDKINEVRERTDIVQVVGEYVALKRSGINWKGLCPFHAEKSPSFNVNAAKQIFHCFGCGKSGDVIRFVMEHEGRPFVEVLRDLAKRAGVDLPEPEPLSPAEREARTRAESDRARMLKLNRLACDFFRAEYAGPNGDRARAYVEDKRGIGAAVRDGFLVGYAPPGWKGLVEVLAQKRVPHELCEAAGLIRARDGARLPPMAPPTERSHFDLFRDRVMCPLIGPQGEIIAFSGRTLVEVAPDGSRVPKYINSPETILYKKGEQLYGLHVARQAIRKADRAILVEGNFDVLMMHERGFSETVAPMGTALTAAQVRLLHRSMPQVVYMLLDGDAAGGNAAARNVGLFLDEDLLGKVAILPQGEDPDTFVAKFGREALELLLKKAEEGIDYFCDHGWRRAGASVIERARLLEEEAAPLLRRVKLPVARQKYAEKLALTLDLPVDSVARVMRAGAASPSRGAGAPTPSTSPQGASPAANAGSAAASPPQAAAAPAVVAKLDAVDLEVVALLADHPRLLQRRGPVADAVMHAGLREALRELAQRDVGSARLDLSGLLELLDPSLRAGVSAAAMAGKYADVASPERTLEEMGKKRRSDRLRSEQTELKKKLAELGTSGDPSTVREIAARLMEIDKALKGPKGQP